MALRCLDKLTPEELMHLFQRRQEPEVFDHIVQQFLRPALAVARQFLPDSAAEDAVQEAFLRVIRGRDSYSPSKPFSGWFFTILRNVCIDQIRKNARHTAALDHLATHRRDAYNSPEDVFSCELELLYRLSEAERQIIIMRVVEDLSFSDIAAALGISEEAAKKRGQRALKRLRESLPSTFAGPASNVPSLPDET